MLFTNEMENLQNFGGTLRKLITPVQITKDKNPLKILKVHIFLIERYQKSSFSVSILSLSFSYTNLGNVVSKRNCQGRNSAYQVCMYLRLLWVDIMVEAYKL